MRCTPRRIFPAPCRIQHGIGQQRWRRRRRDAAIETCRPCLERKGQTLMRLLLPLSLAAMLIAAGCSKDKDVEPPAELVKFPATLPVKKLWDEGVGGGKKQIKLRLGLGPAIDNGVVFAANHKGEMLAVSLETGRDVWVKKLKLPISAGPAAGFGMVVAGTSKGAVIALDGATGRQLWHAQINSELLSSPAISEKVVVLRSVDGRLHGLDAHSGKVLWSVEQQVPRLSLRGTAIPDRREGSGDQRIRQRQGHGGVAQHRRHRLGYGLGFAARPHRTRSAGRYRLRCSRGRRQCVRHRLSGPHRDAGARFRSAVVVPRYVELSRLGGRWRQFVCHPIRRDCRRASAARRRRNLAQRKAQTPGLEHAGRDQHGNRRGRLSRLRTLAGQEHRRVGRARARLQAARFQSAGRRRTTSLSY